MNNVYDNILGLIGNTPMVRLNKVVEDNPAKVFAKLESYNPGHSVKDRIALHIIETAEKKGIFNQRSYHCRNYFWEYRIFGSDD